MLDDFAVDERTGRVEAVRRTRAAGVERDKEAGTTRIEMAPEVCGGCPFRNACRSTRPRRPLRVGIHRQGPSPDRPFLQVTGKIGGEKVGFLSDLEVIRILRERYRLEVKAQKSGSLAMMHTSIEGLDFLWPASRGSAELFRGQALKVEDVMNSPIVVFSWRAVAEAFAKPVSLPSSGVSGAGAEQAKPIVEKIGDSHLVLDMPRFVAAVEAKLPWKQVGLPELFGSVKVKLTSPAESNSGYAFTGS